MTKLPEYAYHIYMKLLNLEIKWRRGPSLSRDVIPELAGLINSLSEGQIALTGRVDQLAKQVEATRRKVYRDIADGITPDNGNQPEAVPERQPDYRSMRTGDPVNF